MPSLLTSSVAGGGGRVSGNLTLALSSEKQLSLHQSSDVRQMIQAAVIGPRGR